jgi:hypothetical protein
MELFCKSDFTPIVRIDRPINAMKRRVEMMVETPSSLVDTISCEFSSGVGSNGRASPSEAA